MQDASSPKSRGQRGQVYRQGSGWACRFYDETGRRRQQGGFDSKEAAGEWLRAKLDDVVKLRRGENVPLRRALPTLSELVEELLACHPGEENTRATLSARLAYATRTLGGTRIDQLRLSELAAWRRTLPERSAWHVVKALRQALNYAVAERLIAENPASRLPNPAPKRREVQPFTLAELEAIAAELDKRFRPLPLLVGLTGLRPEEWLPLERGDVDRKAGVVRVRRVFTAGQLKPYGKQAGSLRAVPLPARAVEALAELPARLDSRLLFPGRGGAVMHLPRWRCSHWYTALEGAGLAKRGPYALRHTYFSLSIAAGVSLFELARFGGTSIGQIEATYGHLLPDAVERARERLDALVAGG